MNPRTPPARGRNALLAGLVLAAVVALSLHAVCDLFFDCGCRPLWAGGAEGCNIQVPGTPECPWCAAGFPRPLWTAALLLGPPALLLALMARRGGSWGATLLSGLLGYALGAVLASLAAALATGYPSWLGFPL